MNTIFERVSRIISDLTGVDKDAIFETTTICDLDIGTLKFANIILDLEDEFHIEIFESQYRKLQTVGDIVEYVQNNS